MNLMKTTMCGCHACNPKPAWMILCEHCGNKRCPHAEHHKFKCTRSNDVGQVGVEGPSEPMPPNAPPPSPDWIKAAAEKIADGFLYPLYEQRVIWLRDILTRHAPATAAKEGEYQQRNVVLALEMEKRDAEIARLNGELLKAREVAESVRVSFFGISSGNLKAIVWHLRQGHDNGSVTRDALANALEHYEANLTRIDDALSAFEKGGV